MLLSPDEHPPGAQAQVCRGWAHLLRKITASIQLVASTCCAQVWIHSLGLHYELSVRVPLVSLLCRWVHLRPGEELAQGGEKV